MNLKQWIRPFSWTEYSQKLRHHIDNPRSIGFFTKEDAKACALRLSVAEAGELESGNLVEFFGWWIQQMG